jgi:hypothetical protein
METLKEEETTNLEDSLNLLISGFNARYTLNDEAVNQVDALFSESNRFSTAYSLWKSKLESVTDTDKLYLTDYIKGAESTYLDAKEFALKHGLIYTNGKKTGFDASMEEISPLVDGQTEIEPVSDESEISIDDETVSDDVSEIAEVVESETETESNDDEEYRKALDEMAAVVPDYQYLDLDEVQNDISMIDNKEDLVDYFNSKALSNYIFDGDSEFTEEELRYNVLLYTGYDENLNGIISMEDWNNFTLDEAKEHVLKTLTYSYEIYNNQLSEQYTLLNSDEYKDYMVYIKNHAEEEKQKLYDYYDIKDTTKEAEKQKEIVSSTDTDFDKYNAWLLANEDTITYIENHDFESPVFSEVIEKDDKGYYISWQKIFDLADENGRLSDNLEFVAYGEVIDVKMPDAPKTFYADKEMSLVSWEVSISDSGKKSLELTLSLPDKKDNVVLSLGITSDNRLVYNTDIATKIFN